MKMKFKIWAILLIFSGCSVTAERSIQDSDYSLKAQHVMQSAMKLPPHILPTLDELDPKVSGLNKVRDDNIGVYVPGISLPVGVYVPKNLKNDQKPVFQNGQKPILTPTQLPRPRPKRKTPAPGQSKRPTRPLFQIHLKPNSPFKKLYDMSKSQSEKVMKNFKRIKLRDHRYIKTKDIRTRAPPRRKRRKKPPSRPALKNQYKLSANEQHPYQFEEANFALPDMPTKGNFGLPVPDMPSMPNLDIMPKIPMDFKERQETVGKNLGLPLPVHSYVPMFVKEALAKSFLKKPERYLQKLYQREKQKKREIINPGKLPGNTSNKKIPQQIKKMPQKTKKLTQQRKRYLKRKQLLDQLLYQQQQLQEDPDLPTKTNVATPNTFTKLSGDTELNFDDSFPWEDAALQNAFKTGAMFGWEKKKQEIEEEVKNTQIKPDKIMPRIDKIGPIKQSVTKTLCFCCDESEEKQETSTEFFKADLLRHKKRKRKRKSITIEDTKQSEQIMLNKEYISDSMKCVNQDPVEVVLVFNERVPIKTTISTTTVATTTIPEYRRRRKKINVPPQLLKTFGPNYYSFDPVKVHFASSTSSPFANRRSGLEVDEDIPNLSEIYKLKSDSTTPEPTPMRAKESTTSKISSLLKAPSMPHIVDTSPGYNVLRLFTGG